jgi:YfiH family protein
MRRPVSIDSFGTFRGILFIYGMVILRPLIFKKYPEIVFGFNTKWGNERPVPFYFNVSFSVGDDRNIVAQNRKLFFAAIGLDENTIAYQKQVHADTVRIVNSPGFAGESDALITSKKNLGLAISTADCTPVFIYDPSKKVIAGVHSGWRSTGKKILQKVLEKMKAEYNSSAADIIVYMGPSISFKNYEVGEEVASLFDKKYVVPNKQKYLLDVAGVNYDILIDFGVNENNIQRSSLCSFEMNNLLHSYRRDGLKSGRSLGIIALKETNE